MRCGGIGTFRVSTLRRPSVTFAGENFGLPSSSICISESTEVTGAVEGVVSIMAGWLGSMRRSSSSDGLVRTLDHRVEEVMKYAYHPGVKVSLPLPRARPGDVPARLERALSYVLASRRPGSPLYEEYLVLNDEGSRFAFLGAGRLRFSLVGSFDKIFLEL